MTAPADPREPAAAEPQQGAGPPPCPPSQCRWNEVYYGYECEVCGDFVAFGCEPWAAEIDGWEDEYAEDE